jgi:hypothetical protein
MARDRFRTQGFKEKVTFVLRLNGASPLLARSRIMGEACLPNLERRSEHVIQRCPSSHLLISSGPIEPILRW